MAQGVEIGASKLGTKQYWNSAYNREIQNHQDDGDDHGTNWFEENGAEDKVVDVLINQLQVHTKSSVLDLGTGNGAMLHRLIDEGFSGRIVGVDYSEQSVELAQRIAAQRHDDVGASFVQWDIMDDAAKDELGEAFDVVLDKGTFDAISLNEEHREGVRLYKLYPRNVLALIKPGGHLILTSCNWTREEILRLFDIPGLRPSPSKVTYPSFSFGGQQGQTICTLTFIRV